MKQTKTIDIDAMFEEVKKPRFGSLDAGVALWLIWRRSHNAPVAAKVVCELFPSITLSMIENFFSSKYGIGRLPLEVLSFQSICKLYGIDLSKTHASQMIMDIEKQYGAKADELMSKVRKRRPRI